MPPPPEMLRRYLLGCAALDEQSQVEAFLVANPSASTAVAELTDDDPFLTGIRAGAALTSDEPALQLLIERIQSLSADALPDASGDDGLLGLASPQLSDEIGRLGPYRILSVLGRGGMGTVYEAEDPQLGRRVALKTMRPRLAARPTARERFLREARAAARLEHDHIVPIFGVGEDRGVPFIAMPLLKGLPLDARIQQGQSLPLTECVRIGREIAEGLAAAHETGMIHRDIKPGNIWLEAPRDRVKLLDFGLARLTNDQENLTQSGAVVGTPAYMAPEQARGREVDAKADLFSLGCVLYELTSGCRPFRGPDTMAILSSLAMDTPPAPRELNGTVPPALSALIMSLLEKDPAARPRSARAVANALADVGLQLAPTVTPSQSMSTKPSTALDNASTLEQWPAVVSTKPRGRWPLLAGLAASVLLVIALAIYLTVIRIETPKGTLVIETDDPTVEVIVRRDGAIIKDRTRDREIDLKVGDYVIELAEKKDGLRLSTDKVTLTKAGRETVKIHLERPSVQVKPVRVPELPGEFVALFNGKDLSGWEAWNGTEAGWEVKDGLLVGQHHMDMLYSPAADYRDFHLRIEWKASKSAIFHLNARSHRTPFWPLGYTWVLGTGNEANDRTGTVGGLAAGGRTTRPSPEPDQWVTSDLILRGSTVESFVNGEKVTDGADIRFPGGCFALRVATPGATVAIRKLEVKRLPPVIPSRARVTDQFVRLFDGKTTSGWRNFAGDAKGMTVEDGCLVSHGLHPSVYSPVGDYRDFHFRTDAWIAKGAQAALALRCIEVPEPGKHVYQMDLIADRPEHPIRTGGLVGLASVRRPTHKAEEWVSLEAIVRGDRITIRVNGKVTTDIIDRRFTEGHLVIINAPLGPPALLKFRNMEIKEFDTPEDPAQRLVSWVRNNGGEVWLPGGKVAPPADQLPPGAPLDTFNLTSGPTDRRINDEDLNVLRNVPALEGIQLVGQDISDLGVARLARFAGLRGLRALHLNRCPPLSGVAIRLAAGFPLLEALYLEDDRIVDNDLRWVADLTKLRDLSLNGTPVTDAGLVHLTGLNRLTALRLTKTRVTADGVRTLAKALPNCRIDSDHGTFEPKK